jgi:hypothetical protein
MNARMLRSVGLDGSPPINLETELDARVGQMVYGTDYPLDWPVGNDFILNAPFLSNVDKEAMLGGTR